MTERAEITVQENAGQRRYEASIEAGVVAGFAEYRDLGGVRVFTHTEVDDAYEGQGIGSALARGALDDVRDRGMTLRAKCPFIKSYIENHPEYADLQA
ncbi:MAG TPA: GNAT family N-acetyltransferase [Nocardioidaceae bacterium]